MQVGCYTVSTGDGKSQIDFSLLLKRFHLRSYNQLFESNRLTFKVVVFPTCAHTVKWSAPDVTSSQYCAVHDKSQKLLELNVSARHRIARGANRCTNKAVKANNESIINTRWDISQPLPPLSLQTGEQRRVCLLPPMLMTMMRAMMEAPPAPPILSTRACSSAPASTQTEYIFTPRYGSQRERVIVHIG